MRTAARTVLIGIAVTTGCARGPRGVYKDDSGLMVYDFKSGGKVEMVTEAMGMRSSTEMNYKFEDDKVKIGPSEGPMLVFQIDEKGCIDTGNMLTGKLCPAKN